MLGVQVYNKCLGSSYDGICRHWCVCFDPRVVAVVGLQYGGWEFYGFVESFRLVFYLGPRVIRFWDLLKVGDLGFLSLGWFGSC